MGGCRMGMALLALCTPAIAIAALGGTAESVAADQVRMKASTRVLAVPGNYIVHELRTPAGTVVREYARTDGTVFAVTWQGPVKPDLNRLLGTYFPRYSQAPENPAAGRRHMRVRDPDFIVQADGHLRAFSGKAYLPHMLPAGVSIEELR